MRIEQFSPLTYTIEQLQRQQPAQTLEQAPLAQPLSSLESGFSASTNFGEQINGALNHVNTLQTNADELMTQVASGNPEDAHKAVIAMEHALMALDFTLQIRNKVLDAYQEIMKTQV